MSDHGDVVGIHLMHGAALYVEGDASLLIDTDSLKTGDKVTHRMLKRLIKDNKSPFPNNFFSCNVLKDTNHREPVEIHSDDPLTIECRDYYGDTITDLYNSNTLDRGRENSHSDDY